MGGFGGYLEDRVLDHIFGKAGYTPPTIYVALSTADPLDDGSGLSEPSGDGYSRAQTSAADWSAACSGTTENAGAVTFNEATGEWGSITHFALMDAASGGNMLIYGALDVSRSIGSGDQPEFAAGSLQISLD